MSVKVETRNGKTSIETDYFDPFGTSHKAIHEDVELLGMMRATGISKLEVKGTDYEDARSMLHDEFDRQYEKTHSGKYFGWYK
ncbi:MAG: hypothetical protein V1906_02070 [Candidatus Woesearchaeota archaeon]